MWTVSAATGRVQRAYPNTTGRMRGGPAVLLARPSCAGDSQTLAQALSIEPVALKRSCQLNASDRMCGVCWNLLVAQARS